MTEREEISQAETLMRHRMDAALSGRLKQTLTSIYEDSTTGQTVIVITLLSQDVGGEDVQVTLVRNATARVLAEMEQHADDVVAAYEIAEAALIASLVR